jgi:hypothetical protein
MFINGCHSTQLFKILVDAMNLVQSESSITSHLGCHCMLHVCKKSYAPANRHGRLINFLLLIFRFLMRTKIANRKMEQHLSCVHLSSTMKKQSVKAL